MIQLLKVLDSGETDEIKINKDIRVILNISEVYIIISDHPKRTIWLWKRTESSVRKKFIGAQISQDLRGKIGLDYSVVPINEGNEPAEFLKVIKVNYGVENANNVKNNTVDYDLS